MVQARFESENFRPRVKRSAVTPPFEVGTLGSSSSPSSQFEKGTLGVHRYDEIGYREPWIQRTFF